MADTGQLIEIINSFTSTDYFYGLLLFFGLCFIYILLPDSYPLSCGPSPLHIWRYRHDPGAKPESITFQYTNGNDRNINSTDISDIDINSTDIGGELPRPREHQRLDHSPCQEGSGHLLIEPIAIGRRRLNQEQSAITE